MTVIYFVCLCQWAEFELKIVFRHCFTNLKSLHSIPFWKYSLQYNSNIFIAIQNARIDGTIFQPWQKAMKISGEHLFLIYRRLIGRPYIALIWQDKIYRNISVHSGGSDQTWIFLYISQQQHITVHRGRYAKGFFKVATTIYIYQ